MLFMKDGGRVLELRHVSDYVNNCYFVLASALLFVGGTALALFAATRKAK